jgi:hypothetical protein
MTYQDQLDAATCANLATAGADRRARRLRSRRRRRGERDQRRDVENHGSIFLLRSRTEIGETFIEDHAPEDALRRRARVEHRYIENWVDRARDAGLEVR